MTDYLRFMRAVLLALGVVMASCRQDKTPEIAYEIIKTRMGNVPALEVRMTFLPGAEGESVVLYPDEAWGESGLFGHLREVKLLQGTGTLEMEPDSGRIRIIHPEKPENLTLSYKVAGDTVQRGGEENYRPIIRPEYFHVFAHNLFAMPEHYESAEDPKARIQLNWTGWEAGEVIHNSFGSRETVQELGIIPIGQFHSAIFVGGDYRVHTERIKGNDLQLAIRGDWIPFGEEEVMGLLTETVQAQRDFWGDHSQEYFTVTMRPFPQKDGSSFQGTGLTNSFATSVSNNDHTELDQMLYLFNHELMHNWIGHTIENEAEEAQYWFSEGFTEYYTAKNISTYGISDKDWGYFIGRINENIRLLESSSVREAPNADVTYENFWNNPDYAKLPYQRGMLFALYLDLQIRALHGNTKSLDHLMKDLLTGAREQGARLSHEHFIETANEYLVLDLTPFFNRHILEGEFLPLQGLFDQLGIAYTLEADLFDLGFRFGPERSAVEVVDTESNAWRAGVRPGDRVISRSIYRGNTEMPVELILSRDGDTLPVTYYPVKKAGIVQIANTGENRAMLKG